MTPPRYLRRAVTAALWAGALMVAATPAARAQDGDDPTEPAPTEGEDEPMDTDKPAPASPARRTLQELLDEVRHPARPAVFHPAPLPHFAILEQAAALLERAAASCDEAEVRVARAMLAPMAMEVVRLRQKGTTFLVVREQAGALRGSGVYVMRCGDAVSLAVQAPHSYFDLNTGAIAYKLFRQTKARWLMLNTVQRYTGRKLELSTDDAHPADMAHNPTGLFQAVHQGVLSSSPGTLFVQLHGFDSSWRDVEVVLSDGRSEPQTWSGALAEAWTGHGLRVLVFGRQFKGLGAMTNTQAQVANAAGGRFLHLELSLEVRRAMATGGGALRSLGKALLAVAGTGQ